ncbi:MAG TPA: hypothetical protein VGM70_04965 [Pseudolysinimonas sp.]|jgi:hypothetical protein
MTEQKAVSKDLVLASDVAAREIAKAVNFRHAMARRYVKWLRFLNPDATPAQVIRRIEREYHGAVTGSGAVMGVGGMIANFGVAHIPSGQGLTGGKKVALVAAKAAAQQAATMLPAGQARLQFDTTTLFALAIADIHGLRYDKDQASALVLGLSNGRVSQELISKMATDLAHSISGGISPATPETEQAGGDWSRWANTLAEALPGRAAKDLVRTIETGRLDSVPKLHGKKQAAIDYGVGALVGGVTHFRFGRDVIKASRLAFPDAPGEFPPHLAETSRAVADLKLAGKRTSHRIAEAAGKAGSDVAARLKPKKNG